MRHTAAVFRVEQYGEQPDPFPSLEVAMQSRPTHAEAQVRTSIEGVVLAEAEPCNGPGTCLVWCTTLAGQDVIDRAGWTGHLSTREVDTVLLLALGDELREAS